MRLTYIGGIGRSGSTLLERLLDAMGPETCGIGESVQIWKQGAVKNERCTCGAPFYDCPFWQKIGQIAFGGWDSSDVARAQTLHELLDRSKQLPALALGRPDARAEEYADLYTRLYDAVYQVTGCESIVDATKLPTLALVLREHTDLDLRVIHVIRDARGVAYSWTKTKRRPGATTASGAYMHINSPVKTALQWNLQNSVFALFPYLGLPTHKVRYEDIFTHLEAVLAGLAEFIGAKDSEAALPMNSTSSVVLPEKHAIGGNPMRFELGTVQLNLDEAWKAELPERDRLAVSVCAAPLLWRYGYRLGATSPQTSRVCATE